GAGPIRRAGPRPETPVLGKGKQLVIEHHLAGRWIMREHQCAGIVEQHLLGDPAEADEGALQSGEPAVLPLIMEGAHMQPARIAKRGDEQDRLTLASPIVTSRSPKSICSWWPGIVSKRVVARAAAASSRR